MRSVKRRRRAAAEWLVQMNTTDDVRPLLPAFETWLEQGPENRAAYRELQEVWRMTETGSRSGRTRGRLRCEGIGQLLSKARAHEGKSCWRRRSMSVVLTRAGAALVSTLLFAGLILRLAPDAVWRAYASRDGELSIITLSDGSRTHLNRATLLLVRETSRARSVRLERGEALFTVSRDRSRPFAVSVGSVEVRAIGTEFSVRRELEGIVDALVSEGSIEVLTHGTAGAPSVDSSADQFATAGDAVHITPEGIKSSGIGRENVRQRLAWTIGMINVDCSLAAAVEEFNRYNRRRLVITDRTIAAKRVQGIFKATNPDAFAEAVQRAFGIPYSATGSASADSGEIRLGAIR